MNEIMLTEADFVICNASLAQAEAYWQNAIATKNLPENFTEKDAKRIFQMVLKTREKINSILSMDRAEAEADLAEVDKIMNAIEEDESKVTIH